MRYEKVKITRDQNTVHNRAVPPWEIPVLEFIFGDGNVVRTDEFVVPTQGKLINHDYPEVRDEFARLVKCYGSDPQSGVPYANLTYGNAQAGVRSLAKLINEAKEDEAEAAKATAPVKATIKPRGRRAATEAVDSLLS
jgi:hypothetical protein